MSIFENAAEETYSQKIARRFEMIGYLLLVPGGLGLTVPFLFMFEWLQKGRFDMAFYCLIPFLIVVPGLILLIGYRKHARGGLAEKRVPVLWLATAVYNFLLLVPCLFAASSVLQYAKVSGEPTIGGAPEPFFVFLVFILGYIFAISCALKAYRSENRKKLY